MLFFIVVCLIFLFLYHKIDSNKATASAELTTWRNEEARREQIGSLDNSVKAVADDEAQLGTHFIQSSDIVPFLNAIEQLGPEVGATASVSSVNTTDGASELLVGVETTGSFDSIYKFLTLLENSPYELDFTSVDIETQPVQSISAKDNTIQAPVWNATFTVELLSFTQ